MTKQVEQMRNIQLEIDELKKRKEDIKKKALEHRDAVSDTQVDEAMTEVQKINAQIEALERAKKIITENEKGEQTTMEVRTFNENKVLHFEGGMDRSEILSTAEYRKAFFKKLQGRELTPEEKRAITSASDSGGAAIPTQTMNVILGQLQEPGTLTGLVTVLNIPNLLSLPIENVTNDASWVAEASDGNIVNDTLRNITLSAHKLIRLVEVTAKLQAMSVDAFEEWIINTLVKKMRAAIENAIINGTGNGQPAGVESLTFNEDNSLTTDKDFTFADLVTLESLIGEDFERNAVFVMNRKTLAKIKNLKDDVKRPLFERIVEDGVRGVLLGYPVAKSRYVADDVIYLADWKAAYVLNFTQPVEITESKEAGFKSGNTVYRALALLDGKPTTVKNSIVKLSKVQQ